MEELDRHSGFTSTWPYSVRANSQSHPKSEKAKFFSRVADPLGHARAGRQLRPVVCRSMRAGPGPPSAPRRRHLRADGPTRANSRPTPLEGRRLCMQRTSQQNLEAGCATKTRLRASLFVAQLSGGAATSASHARRISRRWRGHPLSAGRRGTLETVRSVAALVSASALALRGGSRRRMLMR